MEQILNTQFTKLATLLMRRDLNVKISLNSVEKDYVGYPNNKKEIFFHRQYEGTNLDIV